MFNSWKFMLRRRQKGVCCRLGRGLRSTPSSANGARLHILQSTSPYPTEHVSFPNRARLLILRSIAPYLKPPCPATAGRKRKNQGKNNRCRYFYTEKLAKKISKRCKYGKQKISKRCKIGKQKISKRCKNGKSKISKRCKYGLRGGDTSLPYFFR